MKQFLPLLLAVLSCLPFFETEAQESGFDFSHRTFRGTRVINGHSVELNRDGELDFLISHRFGSLGGGFYEMFGLDDSNIRLGFEYGVKDWIDVGVGRSSLGKAYDGYLKVRLLRQKVERGSPVTITGFASTAIAGVRDDRYESFSQRLSYTYQLLIARKFGDRFSLQLMPSFVHNNLVFDVSEKNGHLGMGGAVRYQISKVVTLLAESYFMLDLPEGRKLPIAFGVDINTGGHVFQLQITNTMAMIERDFIVATSGDFLDGDIHLGFNISRTFMIKGRRY